MSYDLFKKVNYLHSIGKYNSSKFSFHFTFLRFAFGTVFFLYYIDMSIYTLTYNCRGCCLILFDDMETTKNLETNTIRVHRKYVKALFRFEHRRWLRCLHCGMFVGKTITENIFEINLNKIIRVRVTC